MPHNFNGNAICSHGSLLPQTVRMVSREESLVIKNVGPQRKPCSVCSRVPPSYSKLLQRIPSCSRVASVIQSLLRQSNALASGWSQVITYWRLFAVWM